MPLEEIKTIGSFIIDAGSWTALLGLLVILAFPKLRKRFFGNGNSKDPLTEEKIREHDESIAELKGHAEVANKEMGEVKETLGELRTDVKWIKRILDKKT